MAQRLLPFQYEVEKKPGGMTAMAGLPLYFEFAHVMGLPRMISDVVRARQSDQGWTDDQMIMALVMLNLAGGDCVDDLRMLEGDEGFCRLLRELEFYGRTRRERRELARRWRKPRTRTFPSPTAIRDYLELFHDPEQEQYREPHKAFIPELSHFLESLVRLNGAFAATVQRRSPEKTATLDMDATLLETFKKAALYSYKKFKAYQPLSVYWAEQGLMLFGELRDGNVPADYDLLRCFKKALEMVPAGVKKAYLRSDSAGYCVDLLQYCAEVCFVPNWVGHKKHGPVYRYLAIREPLSQPALPSMEGQIRLPFPTMDWASVQYKVTGIVTNRDLPGDEVIRWYRGRCGKSEEAHSIMKEDLAGGKMPSGLFGANAAWWQVTILSFNLSSAMKRLVLGESWVNRRLKAVRFRLINLPGRVLERGRQLFVRLVGGHPSNEILFEARRRMACLCDSG